MPGFRRNLDHLPGRQECQLCKQGPFPGPYRCIRVHLHLMLCVIIEIRRLCL